jgi:acyl carrier protein
MSKTEIQFKLREMLANLGEFGVDFDANADLYADLGMASVKAMQLLIELEDGFGITISDEDFVEATTLERLTELVAKGNNGPSD